MRTKFKLTALLIMLLGINGFSQNTNTVENLIELGKIYRNFSFRTAPPDNINEQLETLKTPELIKTADFIGQIIKTNNSLTDKKYLTRPDTATLKFIYAIVQVNHNLRVEKPTDNKEVVEESLKKKVPFYELVDNYYSLLITGIGNKNQPLDLSKTDFQLNQYNLTDDTQKGIFFLEIMNTCGKFIFGYMNIVKPPKYDKAIEEIKKYPKFNGLEYYKFLDLNFPDFKMTIGKEKQSYKKYYINNYYKTLISHLICLSQDKKDEEKRMDLLLGSILKEKIYYDYYEKKEDLESLFREIKK
ncbi:MAG: hypothetical protein U0W24_08325 [Bacteroidales bacterium]